MKNLSASFSKRVITSKGMPWLTTLKRPISWQAFTMIVLASGRERSTTGTSVNMVGGLHVLARNNSFSADWLERTTMVVLVVANASYQQKEHTKKKVRERVREEWCEE